MRYEVKRCDLCDVECLDAYIDGKTVMGPWANMCKACFEMKGVGLGTGRGQSYVKMVREDGTFWEKISRPKAKADPSKRKRYSESEIMEMIEEMVGYCTQCKEFTTDSVEPDARNYECDACGERRVYGAEEALMSGMV